MSTTIKLGLWSTCKDHPTGDVQRAFERAATSHMGLKAGMFAIDTEKNCYINRNVQWLWVQYQNSVI